MHDWFLSIFDILYLPSTYVTKRIKIETDNFGALIYFNLWVQNKYLYLPEQKNTHCGERLPQNSNKEPWLSILGKIGKAAYQIFRKVNFRTGILLKSRTISPFLNCIFTINIFRQSHKPVIFLKNSI